VPGVLGVVAVGSPVIVCVGIALGIVPVTEVEPMASLESGSVALLQAAPMNASQIVESETSLLLIAIYLCP
jgi:hypothetical protein